MVKRGHHDGFVAVNGRTLEMRASTDARLLFDSLRIEKR
jgi:hypothetical protein